MMQEPTNEFLELLNNKSGERHTCLLALLKGRIDGEVVTDLGPAQEWCFDPDQTGDECYTARYRADGKGAVVAPLIRQFTQDVAAVVHSQKKKAPGQTVGVIRKTDGPSWNHLEKELLRLDTSPSVADQELVRAFGSILHSVLDTGRRLVLFCEVEGEPTVDKLGLVESSVTALLEILPERFALVLAGVKDPSAYVLHDAVASFKVDSDYLATTPPEDRSQPLKGDSARGNDALDIQGEVNALADAIAVKDMEPPFVVGVLGGWGAGKSFVLHLLEERLLAIRRKNILDPGVRASYPYVGHFYLVRFDAWTYAKADLWSSLMQEVLLALNDQIAYEQLSVERKPRNLKALETVKAIEALLGDKDAFNEQTAEEYIKLLHAEGSLEAEQAPSPELLTEQYLESKRELFDEMFARLLTGKDEFSPDVVEMLTRDDADARKILGGLDNDILWSRLQGLNTRLQAELAKEEAGLRDAKLELAESEAKLGEKVDLELREQHWQTYAKRLAGALGKQFKAAVEAKQKKAGVENGIPLDQAIESVGLLKMAVAATSIRTAALFLAFVLAGLLVATFAEESAALWVRWSGVLGGVLSSVVESWSRANQWMKSQVEAFNAFDRQLKAKQLKRREALITKEQAGDDHRDKAREVAERASKVEGYRRKIGLTAGHPTLLDFIADRLREGGYEDRLGVLHQVQQDIRQLTEGLFSSALCVPDAVVGRHTEVEKLLFPRGKPRVVLFIDDLDRCPPMKVVEVLEAAQLLVKTKLFVVVIAMDVRYITKALEKAYEGVLRRGGAPSGLDYIEKIVQIPYRIRPISAEAMPGYLRSQMQLKAAKVETSEVEGDFENGEFLSVISAPSEDAVRIDDSVPPSILAFDEEELQIIEECALAMAIGPRSTKRLVNVMKLIKIIWYRTGQDNVSLDIKKAVIFFLSLSSRYAEIMQRVLLEMENIVASPGNRDTRRKLALLLAQIAKDWGGIAGRHTEWQFVTSAGKNAALLPPDMTVEKLGSRNIGLIRSFSFVGEVDLPPDPTSHQVSLELPEPVRISQHGPPANP